MQVGRELGERQLFRPQLVLQADDLVPGAGRCVLVIGFLGPRPAVAAGVQARCALPERRDACMRRIIGALRTVGSRGASGAEW